MNTEPDKRLLLIRHGELGAAHQGHFIGRTNPPLNPVGRAECAALAPVWKKLVSGEKGSPSVTVSPLLRARMSAKIICGKTNLFFDDRLMEMNFGRWENRTFSEIEKSDSEILRLWYSDPAGVVFPGGESVSAVSARCREFLDDALENGSPLQTIVTHGGVIVHLLRSLFNLTDADYWRWQPERGSLSIVDFWRSEEGAWISKMRLFNLKPGAYAYHG